MGGYDGRTAVTGVRLPAQEPAPGDGAYGGGVRCALLWVCAGKSQTPALLLLLGFSLSIAGLNPTIVSCAGKMTSAASMGIMLPTAGLGAILMPWGIGLVAQIAGLRTGMAVNVLPCVGMLMLAGVLAVGDKAAPHNTTPTKENILGAEQGQGCALKVFARTN